MKVTMAGADPLSADIERTRPLLLVRVMNAHPMALAERPERF